ncbi:hypothetical protein EGK_21067 [Macaca mulatta]|uniref:MAGE domain-containing protein n=1 Tax=Macaca mulatta TaxID=9544 RepID=G7NSI6_MACMU|nr:hypothetical protein EGK_21067 [Macaca mulatta]
MSLEQRSLHYKPEEALEAQQEALGLVCVQAAAASSSPLVLGTLEEVPTAGSTDPPQTPQGASAFPTTINFPRWRQPNESSSSHEEEGPSTSRVLESLFRAVLTKKVADLVRFLLLKYRAREPVTKAEMLERVIKNYKRCFPVIFGKASESLQLVFGIDVKEADSTGHSYVLVTCLGLSYDGLLGDNQIMPKTGFLIIILVMIAMEGGRAPEEEIWEELNVMEVYDGREHSAYGEPRKLLTQDLVQEKYLEYRQVPYSDPARYEFLWGPRALTETSYVKVLEYVIKVSARVRFFFPSLREAALRQEGAALREDEEGV